MKRTFIKDLTECVGETVSISGWVDVRRDHGKLVFLDIRDMSGKIQAVALPNHKDAVATAQTLRSEWVVSVEGVINERPEKMRTENENGNIEMEVLSINVLSPAHELPFDLDTELNLDTYLDNLPLTLRRERARATFKVQSEITKAYRLFLDEEGFTEFQSPKLTGDDAEGGANVFDVPYFNEKIAHLGTSPQFYKQIMVGVFERVYTIGNVFRAEKHATTRHLNEYASLDLEMGFITDHHDIMTLETRLLRYINEHLKETCAKEFALLKAEFPTLPNEIPSMKLREAQELIFKETGADKRKEPDLEPEDERFLCEWAKREKNSDFVFITHYPVTKRPMYTFEDPDDIGYTKSFDLLFRGIEITTGGQRWHKYEDIVAGIKKKGLDPEKFSFYLQTFKYGMPPHGGWGMGLERLTQKFLNLANVKEASLFPRDINRIDTLLHGKEPNDTKE
ncbi:MAG TPA: aspartate--tRNA(Asn) ligase [Candidatus Kaiserbacteria bacterium]|nr:aspartate--tRNA(Asn) ligase [Candidatus Kaiserbacteria bacterium]